MKKLFFLLVMIMPFVVFGQKAKIEFEETSYNFGTINEYGGKAIHNFVFKNSGTVPLILTNVRAGCGCTTPEWSREPIAPGEKGSIKVSFDPRNRPGSFVKAITVNSNAQNAVMSLTIRGNVSRKVTSPSDNYRYSVGTVKMNANNLNLGSIKNTQQIEKKIAIINSGTQPATVRASTFAPHMTVKVTPEILQKGQTGTILIQYDAQKKNDWGFVTDEIQVNVNDRDTSKIQIAASINEDFSSYGGNFEKAPVATFSEKEVNLTDLPKNGTQTHEFYIQNTGKSDLVIRKIKASDSNTSVSVSKNTLKPGKKAKATVTFKTGEAPKLIKIVQFTLNDPQNNYFTYKIVGTLKKDNSL